MTPKNKKIGQRLIFTGVMAVVMISLFQTCSFSAANYEIISSNPLTSKDIKKGMAYTIVTKPNLSESEYSAIFDSFISDITGKAKDIDYIDTIAYDNKDAALSQFVSIGKIATIDWLPRYGIKIYWKPEYEYKFRGILKVLAEDKVGTSTEFSPIIDFDSHAGSLSITTFLHDGFLGKDAQWANQCTKPKVWAEAMNYLMMYPMKFPEVKTYTYTLLWRGKQIFNLTTDRHELDTLELNKLVDDLQRETMRQVKWNNTEDVDKEDELKLELIYEKIFNQFKNKKLSLGEK